MFFNLTITAKLWALLLIILASPIFGQQYDSVYIERTRVDKNNIIFTEGSNFVYSVVVEKDGKQFFRSNQNPDSLTTDPVNASKILRMEVIKPKLFGGRTNKHQTEIMYQTPWGTSEMTSLIKENSGVVENEKNIWLHPSRVGFLRSLETCPFPYIKFHEREGFVWQDQMLIQNYWADSRWGEWDDKLLLNYNYKIEGTQTIDTAFGNIECVVVSSTATSEIGQSQLISYFNEKLGFVRMDYTLFNGMQIHLELVRTNKVSA